VLTVQNFDESIAVGQMTPPHYRKAPAEEWVGGIGNVDEFGIDESGRSNGGINL
jgi:hypothetical protein